MKFVRVSIKYGKLRPVHGAASKSSSVMMLTGMVWPSSASAACSVRGAAAIRTRKFPPKTDFAGLCGESCGDRKWDLQSYFRKSLKYLARPARFERTAFGSGGQRSIRLSYGRTRVFLGKGRAAVKPCPCPLRATCRPVSENGHALSSGRGAARHHGRAASFRDNLLVSSYTFSSPFRGAPQQGERS